MAANGSRLPPIHNLPNEILVKLFLMHAAASRISLRSSEYQHRPHPRCASGWISLMLVSRHWRNVALAAPTLWQAVDVWNTTAWLKLAIDRSCDTPLELYFHVCDVALNSIPLIITQAHRLRKLLLPRFKRSDFLALKILFHTAMPVLDELRVHLDIREIEAMPTRISIDSLETYFPSLRYIRLNNFIVPWTLPALSRMRYLTLRNCAALNGGFTFDQFLDTLEACKELEHLRLHRFVHTIAYRVPDGFSRTVLLPRLRGLSISEPLALCRQLLSALYLSPTLILRVNGVLTLDTVDTLSLFPSMLPEDLSKLPIIPSLRHADVKYVHDVIVLQLWPNLNFSNEYGSITMKILFENGMEAYIPRAIEDFAHLFSSAPLERVYVSCTARSVDESPPWESLFAALPAVHTLTVLPGLTMEPVWEALAGEQLPLLEVDEDAARAFSSLLLPHLRTLRIGDLEWIEYSMVYVLETLRLRAMRGLPRLDELRIDFVGTSFNQMDDDQVREEAKRMVPFYERSLEEFVQSFVWSVGASEAL